MAASASAWRRVGQVCRHSSSAFSDLKKVSTAALRLLYLSSGEQCRFRSTTLVKDFAGDVALQAPDNLSVAFSLFFALADVGNGVRVVSHSNDSYPVEGDICLPVATPIEPEAVGFTAGCR
jgi:hypothetical protein